MKNGFIQNNIQIKYVMENNKLIELGHGKFGNVYLGRMVDNNNQKNIAIKQITSKNVIILEKICNELQVLYNLHNIYSIKYIGYSKEKKYIAYFYGIYKWYFIAKLHK